jgi:hypothetical protein
LPHSPINPILFKRASCVHACNGLLNVNATADEIPARGAWFFCGVQMWCVCVRALCRCRCRECGYERCGEHEEEEGR